MDFLLEKRDILELKLKLTTILLDKQQSIRNQQFEKSAGLREEEKELLQKLNEKKNNLIELQNNLRNAQQSIEEFDHLTMLIEEIKLQESPVKPVRNNSESKTADTSDVLDRINQIKNDILKENNKD